MEFLPMPSKTEGIVDADSGYMAFDLAGSLGYQEWCGMFAELGVKATLFNGYLLQSEGADIRISTTPTQLHLFDEGMYLAPPFTAKDYYFHLPRPRIQLGKVYFKIAPELAFAPLEGHKPNRRDIYAIDIWVEEDPGPSAFADESAGDPRKGKGPGITKTRTGCQVIYTLLYEARIQTDRREYHIQRFESEQLFGQH